MLHGNLYLLIYFVNLTSNIRLIGSRLGSDHLIVKGWPCYPPPHKPYCFHRQQKSYFFTWTISIFLHIFPKTCRNCRVRSFIFLHFLGQKVKFSFPFVFSLKLFFNNLWFSLSHRLSVCLKFAQPINSGTFKKKYFCIRYLDYQSASLCRYR